MRFSNPYALLWLLLIPIVILMYILKQNFERKEISSTFLWDLALKDDEVSTPWQKLKKNILMILQIIVVILITLSLANPYFYKKHETNNAQIIVIDNSASMNAKYNKNKTRLDYAKEVANKKINGLIDGTSITIITVGSEVNIDVSNAVDRDVIKKSINNIKPTYGSKKINDNMDFIYSIADSYEDYELSIVTDEIIENGNTDNYLVNSIGSNVSIDSLATFLTVNNYEILAKITNRYETPVNVHLDIFDENDSLLKGKEIQLQGNESKNILFDNVVCEGSYIYGEIKEKDLIKEDNIRFSTLKENNTKKILLVSEENIFMEKAVLASNKYELFKSKNRDVSSEKYDLYIFDSIIPNELPKDGSFIFINIPEIDGLYDTEFNDNSRMVDFVENDITKHVINEKFIVSTYNKINIKDYMQSIADAGDDSVIAMGNKNGIKFGIVSFDIHNSDLPLNVSFPILMDSLLTNILGNSIQLLDDYNANESISFEPLSTTEKALLIDPTNYKDKINVEYPITYYDNTNKLGVYQLIQENKDKEQKIDYITINYDTDSESTINSYSNEFVNSVDHKSIINNNKKTDYIFLFIILAIVVILYEWKKYIIG
ncbi:hypothetical protein SH1V18_26060 [Vallitalea longa]|uniref:VWFA domain-containing protein n=1 Tax=Vallitalea longa TaxID=2936439 RepID=A0A9W5YCH0_9FIRM|nr:BatA and WFA domain-containing protein [Vallitalea longa]GKX30126.1 hypothetical protein SH1V18_26060 [Vallitalea longa]